MMEGGNVCEALGGVGEKTGAVVFRCDWTNWWYVWDTCRGELFASQKCSQRKQTVLGGGVGGGHFNYLGIRITPKIADFVEWNYNPVIESVSEAINRWSTLPISMIRRINIWSMNVLLKLLCLFHSNSPRSSCWFLLKDEGNVSSFLFGATERPDFAYLCSISLMSGEGWNLLWYHRAARLTTVSWWFSQELPRSWMSLERKMSCPQPLNLYFNSAKLKVLKSVGQNRFA